MALGLGLVVIVVAVFAILRRVDVRLVLVLAGLALTSLAGHPELAVRTFVSTFSQEKFVVPICTAMGFAYVMRRNGCDQHLVRLLVRPLQYVRPLLVPGAVVVGFVVNIPVISQTSTAVAIGAVLVPLLRASRLSPVTTGAALLLGSSLGGELLNPGAPELRSVSEAINTARLADDPGAAPIKATEIIRRIAPLLLVQLGVATAMFWALSLGSERRHAAQAGTGPVGRDEDGPAFRINLVKAAVPLVPLVLLFLTTGPLQQFEVPGEWLLIPKEKPELFDSRLIGAAMLVGTVAAALTEWRTGLDTARVFFEGAGYAFTHIIAIIVAASCFGTGVEAIGLAAVLAQAIELFPGLLLPTAAGLPLGFGVVSGSGMAATQSLFKSFIPPTLEQGADPAHVGALVSIGAAAGRTMSPVAAVTLMCASLTETSPFELARRVAVPLLVGTAVVLVVAMTYRP